MPECDHSPTGKHAYVHPLPGGETFYFVPIFCKYCRKKQCEKLPTGMHEWIRPTVGVHQSWLLSMLPDYCKHCDKEKPEPPNPPKENRKCGTYGDWPGDVG
jgi:hypothetical protein